MKKISKYILLGLVFIILSSCSSKAPEELNSLIQRPKQGEISIKGTWQVVDIRNTDPNKKENSIALGDEIYIDKNLVAIGDTYAFPPNFTSKYANLSKYLQNRGFKVDDVDEKEEVVIVNASQGQLFSKDFIKITNNQLLFIVNNAAVIITKVSERVESKIINSYSKRAADERSTNYQGEEVAEDVALLLGVRERMENSIGDNLYNYYTYLIEINYDEDISYEKAYNIFIKDKEEYWSINVDSNNITDNYDQILSYPARVKEDLTEDKIKEAYSFKDINLNMRINYVSPNYISIDYTSIANSSPITKYAMVDTKNIKDSHFLSLEEYTGEEDSDLIFRSKVIEEAGLSFDNVKDEDIKFDNTNFGIVRDMGNWIFQSSVYKGNGDDFSQKFFPMEIAIGSQMINKASNKASISKDQVKNLNSQAKDYYILQNNKYILIQTADEILIHEINEGLIDPKPIFSIPTVNSTTIISIDEQSGEDSESIKSAFSDYNEIID